MHSKKVVAIILAAATFQSAAPHFTGDFFRGNSTFQFGSVNRSFKDIVPILWETIGAKAMDHDKSFEDFALKLIELVLVDAGPREYTKFSTQIKLDIVYSLDKIEKKEIMKICKCDCPPSTITNHIQAVRACVLLGLFFKHFGLTTKIDFSRNPSETTWRNTSIKFKLIEEGHDRGMSTDDLQEIWAKAVEKLIDPRWSILAVKIIRRLHNHIDVITNFSKQISRLGNTTGRHRECKQICDIIDDNMYTPEDIIRALESLPSAPPAPRQRR
ncbi:hypothetical protein HOD08_03975 [bacterium]|jgi:hypothetical protein|nr:hypothetical protein [bacterium]